MRWVLHGSVTNACLRVSTVFGVQLCLLTCVPNRVRQQALGEPCAVQSPGDQGQQPLLSLHRPQGDKALGGSGFDRLQAVCSSAMACSHAEATRVPWLYKQSSLCIMCVPCMPSAASHAAQALVSGQFLNTSFAGPRYVRLPPSATTSSGTSIGSSSGSGSTPSTWWQLDLGPKHRLLCNYYCIRHDGSHEGFARSWALQVGGAAAATHKLCVARCRVFNVLLLAHCSAHHQSARSDVCNFGGSSALSHQRPRCSTMVVPPACVHLQIRRAPTTCSTGWTCGATLTTAPSACLGSMAAGPSLDPQPACRSGHSGCC